MGDWIEIKPEQVRKDNSNLWRMEGEGTYINEELKKLKFKKVEPEHIDRLRNWVAVTGYGIAHPYEDLDAQLDLQTFIARLTEVDAEIFELFLENYSVKEIAAEVNRNTKTVYRRLSGIIDQYKTYYLEE